MKRYLALAAASFALATAAPLFAHAARLAHVSDTIVDSRLSWPTDHTIVFGAPGGIPAGGTAIVTFEGSAFSLDPSFNYSDVAVAVSTSSPYTGFVDQPVASAANSTNDGATIVPNTGPITITFPAANAVPAGAYVRIHLGGGYQITNPSSTGSYRIFLNTYGSSGAIDYGSAMVAVLPAVSVDVNQFRDTPPIPFGGLPTGTIPSNIIGVVVSLNTDVYSTCRYAAVPGVSYSAMTSTFAHDLSGTVHFATIFNITRGTTYNFYVRCSDFTGNVDTSDYLISFNAGDPTGTGAGGGTGGGPAAPPGTPSGGGGGGFPYPPGPANPSIVISGVGLPNASIAVLQDGALLSGVTAIADSNGNFSLSIPTVPQGTYSFTIEEKEGQAVIASYTATITVIAGTTNSITNFLLPPSISFATSTVPTNATTSITGLAAPLSTIELWVTSQSGLQDAFEATTTTDRQGKWAYTLSTNGFAADTYQIKARASLPQYAASSFSSLSYLGVGVSPSPRGKGDLNGDGKVNLVDFSILLFHWGQSYPLGDLNGNGVIDLPDLSILLYNWTG